MIIAVGNGGQEPHRLLTTRGVGMPVVLFADSEAAVIAAIQDKLAAGLDRGCGVTVGHRIGIVANSAPTHASDAGLVDHGYNSGVIKRPTAKDDRASVCVGRTGRYRLIVDPRSVESGAGVIGVAMVHRSVVHTVMDHSWMAGMNGGIERLRVHCRREQC